MQVFDTLPAFREQYSSSAVTIGKYDGMHLGHQRIVETLKQTATSLELPSVVVLSEPQPEEFFSGCNAPPRITSFDEKVWLLEDFGIDAVYRMTFNRRLSQLSPAAFIDEVLVEGLGARALVVGDDFRFGRGRAGDHAQLARAGRNAGFSVTAIAPCTVAGGVRVSSTEVRRKLAAGDCRGVKQLLGRYYNKRGRVVTGRRLGKQMGIPTANVALDVDKLILQGIFAVAVQWRGRRLPGVASLGYNPTIDDALKPTLEVHLLDFDEDLYGEMLVVSFLEKIRDEAKFADLETLKQRMNEDIAEARSILSGHDLINDTSR